MREITRITLRIGMILILLGGCVHNVYHFSQFANKQSMSHSQKGYYGYSTRIDDIDEELVRDAIEIEELNTNGYEDKYINEAK